MTGRGAWRALTAAGAAWPTAWVCLHPTTFWVVRVLVAAGAALLMLVLLHRRVPGATFTWGLVVVLTIVAVSTSALLHITAWQQSPWPELVEDRQAVEVLVELAGQPRVRDGIDLAGGQRSDVSAAGRVLSIRHGEQEWALRSDVWLTSPNHDPPLRRGDTVRATARANGADLRRAVAASLLITEIHEVRPGRSPRARVAGWFDTALTHGSVDSGALVRGMAVGDDSALQSDTRERVERVGLSHLTAVSGANMAIVIAAVLGVGRFLHVPRRLLLIPALIAMIGYAALVGPEPSVLRASAMAAVMVVAMLVGGGAGLAALGSAVSVLLVWQPALATSRGFALSSAATAGLVLSAPLARHTVARISRARGDSWAWALSAVTAVVLTALAAAVATAPLLAAYGNGVSWVSVLANAAVAALVPLITIGGLLAAAVASVFPALATAIAAVPLAAAEVILTVAHVADSVRFGRADLPAGWLGFGVVAAALVLMWALPPRFRRNVLTGGAVCVAGALVATSLPGTAVPPPGAWLVVFCAVGQGDAALVRTGERSALVVDTGPETSSLSACLQRNGVSQVDAVVLSHFHLDHAAGASEVLADGVGDVWVSPLPEPAEVAEQVSERTRALGIAHSPGRAGVERRYGWAQVQFWGPEELITEGSQPNNNSVVARVVVRPPTAHSLTVLFTGDIEPAAQSRIMRRTGDPAVDVVKVPHHGSANQHPAFASWARAALAVVSCGVDNDYGHPADATVRAWAASGATVRRTDTEGDIYVWRDDDSNLTTAVRSVAR